MGCWNATCGISQLPIHYGNEIVCLILKRREIYNEKLQDNYYCYIDDVWETYGLPFEATYNDYGGVENIKETEETNQLFINLTSEFTKYNKNIPNKKEINSLEDFCNDRDISRDICLFMVHKKIYDCLANSNNQYWHNGKYHTYKDLILKESIGELEELKDSVSENLSKITINNVVQSMMIGRNGMVYSVIKNMIDQKSIDKIVLGKIVNFSNFIMSMRNMRKMLMPQAGTGSQDSNINNYKDLVCSMQEVISDISETI